MAANRTSRLIPLFRRVMDDFLKFEQDFAKVSKDYQLAVEHTNKVVAGQKLTTPKDDVPHIASTYTVYLESTRQLNELQSRYKGGERSIEESANLVGLKLPEIKRM